MATKTLIELIDDVDGTTADETVSFGIDGSEYEIDLSTANADALRDALAHWIDHGRRLSGKRPGPVTAKPAGRAKGFKPKPKLTVADRRAIQAFAEQNNLKVPADRGRISEDVQAAWEQAGSPV